MVVVLKVGEGEAEHLSQHWGGGPNIGQEESILLAVKIHSVITKHSSRPELSNRPYLLPVLLGWAEDSLKTLSFSLPKLMKTVKMAQRKENRYW